MNVTLQRCETLTGYYPRLHQLLARCSPKSHRAMSFTTCENAALPLTLKVAATGKPVIVLSGMATWPSLTQPSRLWMSLAPSAILATTIR